MNTILLILQKEFKQIFRNKMMLPIIFAMPVVQLVVLAYAATFEIKNLNVSVVDHDLSTTSRNLVEKFNASPFFTIIEYSESLAEAEKSIKNNETDLVFNIPAGFERKIIREQKSGIQVIANAINSTVAGVASGYIAIIVQDFNQQLIIDWFGVIPQTNTFKQIKVSESFWYNPELNYQIYMVPGILVLLVTLIGMLLSGLNLVREKEIGTIEQINVTPIKKHQFIIGKLLPFYIIGVFELAFGLVIGWLLFNIPFEGSFFDLFVVVTLYLLVVLGFALFISTLVETQQQALFIDYFFLVVFILMSGVFTAVESMPQWAQILNKINPVAYFVKAIRMLLLKGSTLSDLTHELGSLIIYAFIALGLAVLRYRKTN